MNRLFTAALLFILQACVSPMPNSSKNYTTIVTIDKIFYGKSAGIKGSYEINGKKYIVFDGYRTYNAVIGEKIKVHYAPENPEKVYFQDSELVFCKGEQSLEVKGIVNRVNRTFSFVNKGERQVLYTYTVQGYTFKRAQAISLKTFQTFNVQKGDTITVVVSTNDIRRAVIKFPGKEVFYNCSSNYTGRIRNPSNG